MLPPSEGIRDDISQTLAVLPTSVLPLTSLLEAIGKNEWGNVDAESGRPCVPGNAGTHVSWQLINAMLFRLLPIRACDELLASNAEEAIGNGPRLFFPTR